jgi:hypothetical protein
LARENGQKTTTVPLMDGWTGIQLISFFPEMVPMPMEMKKDGKEWVKGKIQF